MHDEPLTSSESQRQHVAACARCRTALEEIGRQAGEMAALMAVPAMQVDAPAALALARQRIAADAAPRRASRRGWAAAMLQMHREQIFKPLTGAAAALALIGAVTLTPAGSLAQSFITIFQPTQIAPVSVTAAELRTLPDLRKYGTMHVPASVPSKQAADANAASSLAGMRVLTPASLPAGVPSTVTYQVIPGTTSWFTFSAAKARQAAAKAGKPMPAMPRRIDGSTLQLKTGTAVIALYGAQSDIPALVVGQMKAPRVSSTGVTVKELEDYVLSQPGVSPQLASAIRSVGDPTTTLPLPIPMNMATAQQVQVHGVQGLAVGDSTGIGSVVVWEKDGVIYGVGGTLKESDVLDVANGLH